MPGKPFTKTGWKQYHGLRRKGMSKGRAAAITSARKGSRRRARRRR